MSHLALIGSRLAVTLMLALGLVACNGDGSGNSGSSVTADSTSRPPPQTGADAYQYLQEYVSHGLHRTGTSGGKAVSGWVATQFREIGLAVKTEPFSFTQFIPRNAELRFVDDPTGTPPIPVFPLYYSGVTGSNGKTAQLVDVGSGSDLEFSGKSLEGKIVFASVLLVSRALTPTLEGVLQSAASAGAVGVVIAVQGPENLIVATNVDADAGLCGLPVLYVGKQDGKTLASRSGEMVHFVLDADVASGTSYNVIASIPGKSDQILMIGTPINGWFSTAAERGGGVGVLLTLARELAKKYEKNPPPQTILFMASGGHEVGYLGLGRYADTHPDIVQRVYTYLHLGAAVGGTLYQENPVDGSVIALPLADPARTLYVSENPVLLALANLDVVVASMIPFEELLPAVLDPGEQAQMYDRGVPIVSISGTTLFFHTQDDLPGTTSAGILDPVVQAFAAMTSQLLALDPGVVRAANVLASAPAQAAHVCVVPGHG